MYTKVTLYSLDRGRKPLGATFFRPFRALCIFYYSPRASAQGYNLVLLRSHAQIL